MKRLIEKLTGIHIHSWEFQYMENDGGGSNPFKSRSICRYKCACGIWQSRWKSLITGNEIRTTPNWNKTDRYPKL